LDLRRFGEKWNIWGSRESRWPIKTRRKLLDILLLIFGTRGFHKGLEKYYYYSS